MNETEVKLNGCLFGGYEKRSTEAYIEELRTMITKLEKDLQVSDDTNKEYAKKLEDAKLSYQELLGRSEEQKSAIQRQKKELEMNARVIEVQKEKTRARSDTVRWQEELLKEQDEELRLLQEENASLKDKVQTDGEQMLEFERKLEQKVQILKEQEKIIEQLKGRTEKLQHKYEEAVKNQSRYSGLNLEQLIQEGIKIVSGGWKR